AAAFRTGGMSHSSWPKGSAFSANRKDRLLVGVRYRPASVAESASFSRPPRNCSETLARSATESRNSFGPWGRSLKPHHSPSVCRIAPPKRFGNGPGGRHEKLALFATAMIVGG